MKTVCPCCKTEVEIDRPLVDLSRNTVAYGGKSIRVPGRQAEMAKVLVDYDPGVLVSRDHIMVKVWGTNAMDIRNVYVQVKNLRKALRAIGWTINREHGEGYYLDRLEEPQSAV